MKRADGADRPAVHVDENVFGGTSADPVDPFAIFEDYDFRLDSSSFGYVEVCFVCWNFYMFLLR